MKKLIEKTSDKLVKAFLKNKIIAPIPSKFTKKIKVNTPYPQTSFDWS